MAFAFWTNWRAGTRCGCCVNAGSSAAYRCCLAPHPSAHPIRQAWVGLLYLPCPISIIPCGSLTPIYHSPHYSPTRACISGSTLRVRNMRRHAAPVAVAPYYYQLPLSTSFSYHALFARTLGVSALFSNHGCGTGLLTLRA
jgi:hypothetical protein